MLGFGIQSMGAASESGRALTTWDIAEVARTPGGKSLLKRYLHEIVDGPAFKGSPRSAQFLEYILWQSAAGKVADLKERSIGVELFGRFPAYDTGEDAIVRVTASEVRKRLVQHYSGAGILSEFRISLPAGGYIPEFIRIPRATADVLVTQTEISDSPVTVCNSLPVPPVASRYRSTFGWKYWTPPILGIVALTAGVVLSIMNHAGQATLGGKSIGGSVVVPWVSLFDGSRRVLIVASDPNIEEIQRITRKSLSLSDYANRSYWPAGTSDLSPSQVALMKDVLRGDKISTFDGSVIADLASLTPPSQNRLSVKAARDFRVKDIQTDENLVFLGSPRSNPWASMFDPVLDFQFAFNAQSQSEFIRNVHPAKGESGEYIPTAGGYGTGESFAIISIFHNPGYGGRVLLLAGASGEGTEAAGNIVADPVRWAGILQSCHLAQDASHRSLQILLQVETVAGSPNTVNTVACHLLASAT